MTMYNLYIFHNRSQNTFPIFSFSKESTGQKLSLGPIVGQKLKQCKWIAKWALCNQQAAYLCEIHT